jgi:LmbE family N-acetylglucosaminyl deacetylase
MKKRILAVGAHPDDVEWGCGGTILRHLKENDIVEVVTLSYGENGKHTKDTSEAKNAMEKLGIDNYYFFGVPDGDIVAGIKLISRIEELIKKFQPNIIYTHTSKDRHQDHRNCSLAVCSAGRKVPEINLFYSPSTTVEFEPHKFVALDELIMHKKVDVVSQYKTQIEKGIIDIERVKSIGVHWGIYSNTKYAEPFETNHSIWL